MDNLSTKEKLTVQRILSDENLRHAEFPVTQKAVFLAHAGVCPLPSRVSTAIANYLSNAQTGDQEEVFRNQGLYGIRQSAAQLINATPQEIALIGPTSTGLSLIAAGLPLRSEDEILIYQEDYPSNVYPWKNLAQKGVIVKRLKTEEIGKITVENVLSQINGKTRLVALSSCHFLSGWRLEIDEIGRALQNRGILFCVDGIQTIGAFPTSVEYVDFLAADAHKWMLGPCGAGILYVRKQRLDLINPILLGWHNVKCPGFVAQEELTFPNDARKFEPGTHPLAILAGLKACLDLINEVGIRNIAAELLRKREILVELLKGIKCQILHPEPPEPNKSAIVSFTLNNADMDKIHKVLTESKIVTSLRQDKNGKKYIRVSPHFYNTDDELKKFAEKLYAILKK